MSPTYEGSESSLHSPTNTALTQQYFSTNTPRSPPIMQYSFQEQMGSFPYHANQQRYRTLHFYTKLAVVDEIST